MIELGPKLRSTPATDSSNPVRMALTPMIVPVPMITPNTVRKARSLAFRIVWIASTMPLVKARRVILFLHPKGFDRIEPGRTPGGVDAEEQPHRRREPHADQHRGVRQRHWNGGRIPHDHREAPRQDHADQSARAGEGCRFDEVLIENVGPPRAQGFADTDLVR